MVGLPVATGFWRLPTTWELVPAPLTVPLAISVFDPVVMLPLVSVSAVATVVLVDPLRVTPLELLTIRVLKVVAAEPAMFSPEEPLKVAVLVAWVNVPLLVKFPLKVWVKVAAANVVP